MWRERWRFEWDLRLGCFDNFQYPDTWYNKSKKTQIGCLRFESLTFKQSPVYIKVPGVQTMEDKAAMEWRLSSL